MDVDDSHMIGLIDGQRTKTDFGHVDSAQSCPIIDIPNQSLRNLDTDSALSLFGAAANMRCENYVFEPSQILCPRVQLIREVVAIPSRFGWIYVQGSAGDLARTHGIDEGRNVDDMTTTRIDQVAAPLHLAQFFSADHAGRFRKLRHVAGDEISSLEEFFERGHLLGRAQGHQVDRIVINDGHAKGLGKHRELGSDVTIANDTQCLTTNFPAAITDLVPGATVELIRSISELARKGNNLSDDQFGDAARIAEGRVEDGNASLGRVFQVDLIGADAKTADDNQVFGSLEHPLGELCLGADANHLNVAVVVQLAISRQRMNRASVPHRIFSMSSSSGKEDFREVTW